MIFQFPVQISLVHVVMTLVCVFVSCKAATSANHVHGHGHGHGHGHELYPHQLIVVLWQRSAVHV